MAAGYLDWGEAPAKWRLPAFAWFPKLKPEIGMRAKDPHIGQMTLRLYSSVGRLLSGAGTWTQSGSTAAHSPERQSRDRLAPTPSRDARAHGGRA